MRQWFFTSESVTEGHPDKVADQISDAVVDAALSVDPNARVACETLVTTGLVVVAGELRAATEIDFEGLARQTIRKIGYVEDPNFHADTVAVQVVAHTQSPDIALGVDGGEATNLELGAGDQGLMFGYAVDQTPELMPLPIALAHRLAERLAHVRKSGTLPYLRPDGKTQVTVEYQDKRPIRVTDILISTQHDESIGTSQDMFDDLYREVISDVIPQDLLDEPRIFINPTGRFVIGGPHGDTGLTGRKIIVDTYGGYARHGGGAFSGKDASKVDRSAAYGARHAAKTVVAAGLATECEIQVSYAIGRSEPFSLLVDPHGTSTVDPAKLESLVADFFDFRPSAIIDRLKLTQPGFIETAAYGHFGRPGFTWESTDAAAELARAAAAL